MATKSKCLAQISTFLRLSRARYNPHMKAYVVGYRGRDKDKIEPPKRPFDPVEDLDVWFSKGPEYWKIASLEEAEPELQYLRNCRVHIGSHYCEFSIEELPGGEFAVVCLSHPELDAGRA
jgi:hypothetical protein